MQDQGAEERQKSELPPLLTPNTHSVPNYQSHLRVSFHAPFSALVQNIIAKGMHKCRVVEPCSLSLQYSNFSVKSTADVDYFLPQCLLSIRAAHLLMHSSAHSTPTTHLLGPMDYGLRCKSAGCKDTRGIWLSNRALCGCIHVHHACTYIKFTNI